MRKIDLLLTNCFLNHHHEKRSGCDLDFWHLNGKRCLFPLRRACPLSFVWTKTCPKIAKAVFWRANRKLCAVSLRKEEAQTDPKTQIRQRHRLSPVQSLCRRTKCVLLVRQNTKFEDLESLLECSVYERVGVWCVGFRFDLPKLSERNEVFIRVTIQRNSHRASVKQNLSPSQLGVRQLGEYKHGLAYPAIRLADILKWIAHLCSFEKLWVHQTLQTKSTDWYWTRRS